MKTRAIILISNLLLLLAYSAYVTIDEIRHPPWGHTGIDNTAVIAFFMFFHFFLILIISIIDQKRMNDWLLAMGMVLVIGFSVCRGSGDVVDSGRYKQYEARRDSNGYFIE